MKKQVLCLAFSLFALSGWAQRPEDAGTYAETITQEDLYDYLSILASDALEGRETGERGQKMAAAFISHHFAELGLHGPVKNSSDAYLQKIPFYTSRPGQIWVKAAGKTYTNPQEILYMGNGHTVGEKATELVFAGQGEAADYAKIKAKDKAVLLLASDWRRSRSLAAEARKQGATAVFIAAAPTAEEHQKLVESLTPYTRGGGIRLQKPDLSQDNSAAGTFFVSPETAGALMGTSYAKLKEAALQDSRKKLAKLKARPISLMLEQKIEEIEAENVLGYLEGTDKKDELLVLTAHYDHIGRQGEHINNGADDDGSGTAAVMEIAEAFVKAKQEGKGPRRSILFMLVTAEEKGLLGSEYYASNPVFPLTATVANLNIDMIGRVDPKHEDNPDYVYLVGADRLSSELHEISERTNATYSKLELDYTYNDESHPDRIYYRSDHWNFAKNNIPVIFYFNGVHADYHKPSDTIDKINFEALQKRTHLVFYTAWELANRDNRPAVDKAPAKSTP